MYPRCIFPRIFFQTFSVSPKSGWSLFFHRTLLVPGVIFGVNIVLLFFGLVKALTFRFQNNDEALGPVGRPVKFPRLLGEKLIPQ